MVHTLQTLEVLNSRVICVIREFETVAAKVKIISSTILKFNTNHGEIYKHCTITH